MIYKKNYSKEELQELAHWYETHRSGFPKTFDTDAATHYADMQHSTDYILNILNESGENPTFSGQVFMFFSLRDALTEAGF